MWDEQHVSQQIHSNVHGVVIMFFYLDNIFLLQPHECTLYTLTKALCHDFKAIIYKENCSYCYDRKK